MIFNMWGIWRVEGAEGEPVKMGNDQVTAVYLTSFDEQRRTIPFRNIQNQCLLGGLPYLINYFRH